MVMPSNTVSYPKAMMIVSLNTYTTFSAMTGTKTTNDFTDSTVVFLRLDRSK
jgi:hypothetical protein